MKTKKNTILWIFLLFLNVQLACNISGNAGTPDTAATFNALYTVAAQTQQSFTTPIVLSITPGLPLPTGVVSAATASSTQQPTLAARCDAVGFVEDVSVSDGSVFGRGADFKKIWRLKNIGTCTWTTSYALVFVNGDLMSGATKVALPTALAPGQVIDLAVNFIAPVQDGHYRGYWKLRNSSGGLFGIGTQADTSFWVDINVKGASYELYNFAEKACEADWENNNTSLTCPGNNGASKGFVLSILNPVLEDGTKEDEKALVISPKQTGNGFISGQFPAIKIKNGDHFKAWIGCQHKAFKCNVLFSLHYRSDGQLKTLGVWHEVYEGQYYVVDVDLSYLSGESVKFFLNADANGEWQDDEALWFAPRITRQGDAPIVVATNTATSTPTSTSTLTSTATSTATSTLTSTATPTSTATSTVIP